MKKILLLCSAIALSLLPSRGENVLSDSFSYADGPIVGALGSPWVNNSGATPMLVTNSTLEVSTSRAEDIAAPLSRILTNGTDTAAYASFKVRFIGLPATNGAYFGHFTAAGGLGNHRGRIWASLTNTAAPGKLRLGIGNTTGSSAATAPWPIDLDTNVVYLVVTRIDLATGASTLWIDPLEESSPSVTDSTPVGAMGISHWGFRQANGEGTCRVDDLRVGSTFADVAGANNPPGISSIGTVRIAANASAGPLSFSISDSETPLDALVLARTSSNEALLPTNNIVIAGTGGSRTVTLTPVAGQEGTASVSLSVTDEGGATASTTFTVIVGAPGISDLGNQSTPVNTALTGIAFTVTDAETPNTLTVTVTSTNTTLIPEANVVVSGTGPSRTLSITPAADQVGISRITLTVSDGNQTASDSFLVTVFPSLGLLINESFTYADDTSLAGGSTDWISHSGTFGQTKVNGGKVFLSTTNDEDFNREFFPRVFAPDSGVILYSSFKVNFSLPPTATGGYFSHFKDDGTINFRGRLFSTAQGAPAGQLRIGVANTAASVTTNGLHPTFLETNQTYTIVTRYNVGTDETTLWVNPASEASPGVTATDAATPITVYSFAFRQSTGIGSFTVDDLKIGTQFTDVATVIPSASITQTRLPDALVLSWPAASGFVLQSSPSLAPADWQDVTQPAVVVEGANNVVTNSTATGSRYFRLRN